MNDGIKKAYVEKFKELKEMEGRISHIIVSIKTISEAGNLCAREKWVSRLEIANTKPDWFEALRLLQAVLIDKGQTKIAMYPPCNDPSGLGTRKMAECIFRDTNIKCLIYVKARKEVKYQEKIKKEDSDAIIIKQQGKSSSELLRVVKDKIPNSSETAKHIGIIRESKRGGLVMVLEKGGDGKNGNTIKDNLRQEVEEGLTVLDQGGKQSRVIIKDIDGVATKSEVEEAIKEYLGDTANIRILNMRPFFAGNQAATIAVNEGDARILISTKKNQNWTQSLQGF